MFLPTAWDTASIKIIAMETTDMASIVRSFHEKSSGEGSQQRHVSSPVSLHSHPQRNTHSLWPEGYSLYMTLLCNLSRPTRRDILAPDTIIRTVYLTLQVLEMAL